MNSRNHKREGETDLDDLMDGYQKADPAATASLIAAVTPLLYRYFCYRPGSRRCTADLVQDTWLRIHKSRHTFRPGEPVLPWVYSIARHTEVDGYRKRRRTEMVEQQMDVLPEVAAQGPEPRSLPSFESLMAELPDSQREVVTMLKVTGMSIEEVARATANTVGSVKQKAHRAYEKLRRLLECQMATREGQPR